LPFGEHQQDNVVVGPDGRLYVGSGSTCNACAEADPRSAAILSVEPDGSDLRVVAHGVRNPYGLAFQPGTGVLYASVNGVDYLDKPGDPEPADTLVRVQDGALRLAELQRQRARPHALRAVRRCHRARGLP
jgi:glucose/arabinose dehydrogenase